MCVGVIEAAAQTCEDVGVHEKLQRMKKKTPLPPDVLFSHRRCVQRQLRGRQYLFIPSVAPDRLFVFSCFSSQIHPSVICSSCLLTVMLTELPVY